MKKYAIDLDITKCISCGACSVACMDQNDFQVKEGQRPFRNVFDLEMEQKGNVKYSHLSLACMHCSDAPCISACPSACLKKDPETNLTVYDTTNCIGCHSCAMACPYGIPSFGENGKMIKCDGCYVNFIYTPSFSQNNTYSLNFENTFILTISFITSSICFALS